MRLRTKLAVSTLAAIFCFAVAGPGKAAVRHPPVGSYQQTCGNIVFSNAGVLTAQCKDAAGHPVLATLRTPACGKGDIANLNGHLTCQPLFVARPKRPSKPGPVPITGALPPGSVILFEDIDYKGRSLATVRDTTNLTVTGFNDKASSIRVTGGRWQLCVDVNYRGHCTILDKDSPNLSRFNLNDRVSSVRRVG